jgi:hypothetical protein
LLSLLIGSVRKDYHHFIENNSSSMSGKMYSLNLSADNFIRYGLEFDKYHKFEVVVTRQHKKNTKTFWIKIKSNDSIPLVNIHQARRTIKNILLNVKISYDQAIHKIEWMIENTSGNLTVVKTNSEQLKISKQQLITRNATKIFVQVHAINKDNQTVIGESFWNVVIKPPILEQETFKYPSLTHKTKEETKIYKILDIKFINIKNLKFADYPIIFSLQYNDRQVLIPKLIII